MQRQKTGANNINCVSRIYSDAPEIIDPPSDVRLTKAERAIWDQVIVTRTADSWRSIDLIFLADFARITIEIRKTEKEIRKAGNFYIDENGIPKIHPLMRVRKELRNQQLSIARAVGLNMRAPLSATPPGSEKGANLPLSQGLKSNYNELLAS